MRVENSAPSSSSRPHEAPLISEKIARTVTRYDLATAIMKRLPHVSRRKALDFVDCALEEIAEALLQRGECVKLHEFGTFCVRERTVGAGHAPLAIESVSLPRRKVVRIQGLASLETKSRESPRSPNGAPPLAQLRSFAGREPTERCISSTKRQRRASSPSLPDQLCRTGFHCKTAAEELRGRCNSTDDQRRMTPPVTPSASPRIRTRQPAVQYRSQDGFRNRLGDIVVHPGIQARLPVAGHDARGHGDDRPMGRF